jgi:hypothetical protein
MLDSHPDILCHGEVFTPFGVGTMSGHWMNQYKENGSHRNQIDQLYKRDRTKFLQEIIFDAGGLKRVGFKFKTEEYFNPSYNDIADYVKRDQMIDVIHLRRRDLLSQYISEYIVSQQRGPTVKLTSGLVDRPMGWIDRILRRKPNVKVKPFNINKNELLSYLNSVCDREEEIETEMKQHRIHEIWYEDILTYQKREIDKLEEFLGVKKCPLIIKTEKILNDHYSLVNNFSEIKSFIMNSKYSKRINLQ